MLNSLRMASLNHPITLRLNKAMLSSLRMASLNKLMDKIPMLNKVLTLNSLLMVSLNKAMGKILTPMQALV
jgi:hypothetical protein